MGAVHQPDTSDKLEQSFPVITVQHQDRSAGRAGAPPRRPTEFHFGPARLKQFSCRPIFLVLRHGRRSWPLASPFPSGECQSADGHTRQDMDTCFQPRRSADDRRPIEKMKTIFALKSFRGSSLGSKRRWVMYSFRPCECGRFVLSRKVSRPCLSEDVTC